MAKKKITVQYAFKAMRRNSVPLARGGFVNTHRSKFGNIAVSACIFGQAGLNTRTVPQSLVAGLRAAGLGVQADRIIHANDASGSNLAAILKVAEQELKPHFNKVIEVDEDPTPVIIVRRDYEAGASA